MRALVTGSSGFIGTHLVRRLHQLDYQVTGIDRRAVPSHWEYRIDLTEPSNRRMVTELVAATDVVFHLAARPGVRDPAHDIETIRHRDNVLTTGEVLRATPLSTPLIMTSSSSVYGSAGSPLRPIRPCHEDDPLNPKGGYARSKMVAETLCRRRAEMGGRVTVVRPFTVAGEGQRPDMAFATWIGAATKGHPIRLFGSPNRIRDITDVTDIVRGLIAIHQGSYDGILNLGTGTGHRIVDMARTVIDVVGRPVPIELEPGSIEEVDATLADTRRCRQVLGFVPNTDLGQLVHRMVDTVADTASLAATYP